MKHPSFQGTAAACLFEAWAESSTFPPPLDPVTTTHIFPDVVLFEMPLAKPYPIPDLIIPLDDDDFEEEEIEVHSLQQQVRF